MRAVVQSGYGAPQRVLQVMDVPLPTPGSDEVLVAVEAASVHPDVWHVIHGLPRVLRVMGSGLIRPRIRIPGTDMAGVVRATGSDVTGFGVGDRVYGETIRGHQWKNGAAYAEYVTVRSDSLAHIPDGYTFAEAAAIPTAAYIASLNMAHVVRDEDRVLVNGAAGGVGMFAMQIAKALGAHVSGVDTTSRLDAMIKLGADEAIDYTVADFTEAEEPYDVIVDIPGNRSFDDLARVVAPNGAYVLIGHEGFATSGRGLIGSTMPRFMRLQRKRPFGRTDRGADADKKRDHRIIVRKLVREGALRPILDEPRFELAQVSEAISRLESGAATGRIVLHVGDD